ncbi:HAD family hydrolase [Yinghuangia aomiensis]
MRALPLVLWDIDHTLIDTGGVGRDAFAGAYAKVVGEPMREQASLDGRTEPVIFAETVALHGLDPDAFAFEAFGEALAAAYLTRLPQLRANGHALPGAYAAINALHEAGAVQTIVTGNVRAVAEIKVSTFGLNTHLDFDLGAYADDHTHRPELVRIAVRRAAAKHPGRITPSHTTVIGDTPNDIDAAKEAGVRVLAVASGTHTGAMLADAGADHWVHDLRDTGHVTAYVVDVDR